MNRAILVTFLAAALLVPGAAAVSALPPAPGPTPGPCHIELTRQKEPRPDVVLRQHRLPAPHCAVG